MGNEDGRGTLKNFNYFSEIITDDMDQDQVYERVMKRHVDLFMSGYNVNVLTHGQTGSGKTHTIFGPKGSMDSVKTGEIIP